MHIKLIALGFLSIFTVGCPGGLDSVDSDTQNTKKPTTHITPSTASSPTTKPVPQDKILFSIIHKQNKEDLYTNNYPKLKKLIDAMTARSGHGLTIEQARRLIENKKLLYFHALDSYKNNILPQYKNKDLIGADNRNQSIPSRDASLNKIHDIKIASTPNFMKYYDTKIQQNSRIKEYLGADSDPESFVITYLDFANASLGGGAFGSGLVQEETMFLLCPELPLYLSERYQYLSEDSDLKKPENLKYITRTTRLSHEDSASPKYFAHIRCSIAIAGKLDKKMKSDFFKWNLHDKIESYFPAVANPAAINILALAATEIGRRVDQSREEYNLSDAEDFFNNTYKAFELAINYNKKFNPTKNNLVYGGLLGAGAFGHSKSFSIAMQILVAKLLGVNLILTGIDDLLKDDALAQINTLLGKNPLGTPVNKILGDFIEQIKNNPAYKLK